MPGAPSGKRILVQRVVRNDFNVIVAPGGPYTDVDVSVRFKPISGREDASGGIVFRFSEGRYYVVRANALEDNFRLYYYERGRYQLATAKVAPPTLGQWHTLRVVAVAMGMLSPGPVVITATFVGYLVAGFWGSVVATVGIFLPSFLMILIVAPILTRHRANPNVKGFVKGAYAAAIGTILGACILLGKIAIGDWLTALVGVLSLVVLVRWKISNPVLVAVTAVIGLIAFPLLQPTWVFVK